MRSVRIRRENIQERIREPEFVVGVVFVESRKLIPKFVAQTRLDTRNLNVLLSFGARIHRSSESEHLLPDLRKGPPAGFRGQRTSQEIRSKQRTDWLIKLSSKVVWDKSALFGNPWDFCQDRRNPFRSQCIGKEP